jgi:class 3 adenylate cyclase/tetratricopeptide (TPR) repeat protein
MSNEPEAGFCGECGSPLGAAVRQPSGGRPGATLAPVTERRLVTVLFADLVGFTPFADERDAEDVRDTLNRYFEVASEVIGRHGGTIEKFIGDAVMAMWGAPTAREDDAERGVRAGLELVDVVRTLGPSFQGRVGVLTGEAAVTLGASGQGMVAGDLVNTASRLQSVAQPSVVLVGEATMHAASRSIAFEAVGDQALKGKAAPVPAWRALRVVAEKGGRGRSDALEPPFVGRVEELRLLKELLHATGRDRRPRLVSVTGIAGIGKSRLAWEFLKYVDGLAEPVLWHTGRSPAYGDGVSFWALGEMVRSRAGLVEGEAQATVRERIAEAVRRWIPDEGERRWIEPALLALLGSGDMPAGRQEELYAAWRTFFERLASEGTVVMVFEDLQWADPGLLGFIDHLLEWSREVPILVLTLARPELLDQRPHWAAGRRELVSISLGPLRDDDVHGLLVGLVPDLPVRSIDAIVERCDGIPLYAVEFVRMLVADGRIERRDSVLVPAGPLSALGVPETLHELIGARLDALDPDDRSLLADAAVLGQSFAVEALEAVSGRPREELDRSLRSLVHHELVARKVDSRSPERGQYAFMQALVREVAHERLARRDRRTRHLAVARWFGGLGSDELAGALAGQYLAAYRSSADGPEAEEVADEARPAISVAAERAASLGSHAQAVGFLEQALAMTNADHDRAPLLERAARSASLAADHEAAERFLQQAIAIRRELGDRPAAARASAELGAVLIRALRYEAALAALESAVVEFADLAGHPAVAALDGQLSRALLIRDQPVRAIEVADRALASAEHLDLVEVVADALITRGAALCGLGRAYEGAGATRTGIALAEVNGQTATVWRGRHNLSGILGDSDMRGALDSARAALALAARRGDRPGYALGLENATGAAVETGDWEWALRECDAALEVGSGRLERAELKDSRLWIDSLRGEDVTVQATEIEQIFTSADEAMLREAVSGLRFEVAFGAGRLQDAFEAAMEHGRIHPMEASFFLPYAAVCALWQRDRVGSATALAALDAAGAHGRVIDMNRRTIRAGLAALDGRDAEALAGFRAALDGWRDLGAVWRLALTAITMATLLDPEEPEVRAAADEAREILTRLGAKPFLERLDATVATSPRHIPIAAGA